MATETEKLTVLSMRLQGCLGDLEIAAREARKLLDPLEAARLSALAGMLDDTIQDAGLVRFTVANVAEGGVMSSQIDSWDGLPRRRLDDGRQAVITPLTFGRARICIGGWDEPSYTHGY